MLANLRFALRQLRKSPGFAFVTIATLALGIGACAAMFSVVNAVLLKPLPFREPARLVWIENILSGGLSGRTLTVNTFKGWQEQSKSFESLAAYYAFFDYGRLTLTGSGEPERFSSVLVTENFLQTLGVPLLHGRNFTTEECGDNGPGAAILSYNLWQRRFNGDPAIIGRAITLNDKSVTIVGVLAPTFDFAAVFSPGSKVDLLSPFPLTAQMNRQGNTLFALGRLRPGVSVAQAQAELKVVSENLRKTTVANIGLFGANVSSLDDALRGKFRNVFFILSGAVACVLAIACVNLSNLLLARGNARRQEFAVRVALGASRGQLVQQALTESLLLAFAGALVGVPLAIAATCVLAGLQTFGVPMLQNASVDVTALAVTLGLTTLAGIACGVLPALQLARGQRGEALQNATHQRSSGRSSASTRNTLVIAEVALACMLLIGAGLLFRSFGELLKVNVGFQPQHAMAWRVDPSTNFKNGAEAEHYFSDMMQRVAALPGVQSVGLSDTLPLGRNRSWGAGAVGAQYPEGQFPVAFPRIIDPHYLQTMKISLLAGRYFDEHYDPKAEKTIIINEALAHQLWPGRDPLGQQIRLNGPYTVIGVVANVRHSSLENAGGNEMYLDFRQSGDWSALEMVVRSTRPPASLVPEVRATLAAYDPKLPSTEFYELEQLLDNAVAPRRLATQLLGSFSALALILASLGLYGVIAYSVAQRTQEIGIRMAIGAQRSDVLRLILAGGFKLVLIGVALGLIGSFALTHLLQSQLYGVTAHDPLVFAGNAALLVVVAAIACIIPALRATKVDPMIALRSE